MHSEEWKGWHAPGSVPATHPKLQNHSHADSGNDTVLLYFFLPGPDGREQAELERLC